MTSVVYRCEHLPRLCSGNETRIFYVSRARVICRSRRSRPAFRYEGPSEGYVAHITEPTRQGGIVSIYYFGTLLGCLMGGVLGDRYALIVFDKICANVSFVGLDVSEQ